MSEIETLAAEPREQAGKGAARAVRRDGRLPAIIYGAKKEPVLISLDGKLLRRQASQAGFQNTLLNIKVGGKTERVLPRDVQFDPVTDIPLHVDFLRVSAREILTVSVPVNFLNEEECPGLRKGGVLNVVRHEIELSCRADRIPAQLDVDLGEKEVGDSVHISEVTLPEGVQPTIQDRDFTIATIAAPSALKSEAAEEAEEAEETEEEEGEED